VRAEGSYQVRGNRHHTIAGIRFRGPDDEGPAQVNDAAADVEPAPRKVEVGPAQLGQLPEQ